MSVIHAGRWSSSGTSVSSTNKTDFHDIAEILLKVALHTINLIPTYKRQELLTLREHMGSPQFLVGFVPLIFLVFCVVFCFCFCILSLLLVCFMFVFVLFVFVLCVECCKCLDYPLLKVPSVFSKVCIQNVTLTNNNIIIII